MLRFTALLASSRLGTGHNVTVRLHDIVRQRANLVRLSGQHIQRMQKALELMNLKLTNVVGDITGVTGLKIIRAIVAGERDPEQLGELRDRRCKHTKAEIATALAGRYRDEYLLELQCCLALWEKYQETIALVDSRIAIHLKSMIRQSELPPLPKKPRVRGRKPHDPGFDVRTALYLVSGVDLTAIEGIDEIHALTLISELGTDFTKWPTVKHFTSWLGLCPNFKKTGGKVQSSKTRRGKGRGPRLAVGCVGVDAEHQLPGWLFKKTAFSPGSTESDHGNRPQAGQDYLPFDAVWR
ncbi:MAG: transposase [Zavarzinella sp.]